MVSAWKDKKWNIVVLCLLDVCVSGLGSALFEAGREGRHLCHLLSGTSEEQTTNLIQIYRFNTKDYGKFYSKRMWAMSYADLFNLVDPLTTRATNQPLSTASAASSDD